MAEKKYLSDTGVGHLVEKIKAMVPKVPVATTEAVGTVKPDDKTIGVDGNGTISVKYPGTANDVLMGDGSTKTLEELAELIGSTEPPAPAVKIYGVDFADFPTSTKGTRTDAAAEFGDPTPAVSNGDGSSPFDDIAPWSGMKKVTRTGGSMVEIPKFWYKLAQSGDGVKVQIATGQMEGFSVSPAHMDRGDGKGERDVVYVGRYHCDSSYKSTTKVKPIVSITHSVARTGCQGVGTGYYMMDFATRFTLWLLYLVEFADWNSQATIGYGTGNNSAVEEMGYTDAMTYHTGTTQADRTTQAIGCQYRWIEGPWDNCLDWLDGIYNATEGIYTTVNPSEFADNSGGTLAGASPASGYPSKLKVSETGQFPMFYSTEAKGSATTGTCDYWSFNAASPCVHCGGYYYHSDGCGWFRMNYGGVSGSGSSVGVRLLELP